VKILRLELTDWRRFRGGPTVVEFHERGNVLTGPNEAGKSTLFEAVRRALFDRSKTSASWVGRLQPYGLKGALPTVRLEFEYNGRTWAVRKSFGGKGGAELSERQGGEWTALAKNEEAEEMLLELLGAEASKQRDGSPPKSWGAFQWLFVPQHLRALPEAGDDAASKVGLDDAGVSPEFDLVWEPVRETYDRSYGKKRSLLKSSDVRMAEAELETLKAGKEGPASKIAELDAKRSEYEEIEESLPQHEADAREAQGGWDRVQEEVVDLSGARGKLETTQAELQRAQLEADQVAKVLKERTRREKKVEDASEAHERATERHIQSKALFAKARELEEDAKREAKEIGDAKASLQDRNSDAKTCLRIREMTTQLDAEKKRLERAKELDASILEEKASFAGDPPDADTVKRAEELVGESRVRRLRLQKFALQVNLEGSPELRVLLDGAPLEGDESIALKDVVIEAPGGGTVKIQGDTREAVRLESEAESLEAEAAALFGAHGVKDLDGLRELREERLGWKSKIEALEAQRKGVDERATETFEQALASLEAEIRESGKKRGAQLPFPEHDTLPETELKSLVDRLEEEVASHQQRFTAACERRETLKEEAKTAEDEAKDAEKAYTMTQTALEGARKELEHHLGDFGNTDRCTEQDGIARETLGQAEAAVLQSREDLARLEKDSVSRWDTAKKKVETLRERVHSQRARAAQLRDTLERESGRGAYTELAELECEIESEEGRLARMRIETGAVKLLHDAMEEVRGSAVSRVVAPIREDLDRLLSYTTRGRYDLARLNDALLPEDLEGTQTCRFEDASEGLRELVATLVRLAVVTHLSKTEPQTLILDDPCVHISRERTVRLVEALNRITGGGRVQAIVLTHREHEFAGLEGDVVDLPTQMRCV